MFCLPQDAKWVEALPVATDGAGRTGDWISLSKYRAAFILVSVNQGNAATIAISINQATAVAGTGAKPLVTTVPIASNLDCAATDTLVRRSDGVAYSTDAGLKSKQIIFGPIPVTSLDLAGGFDCLAVVTGASNVANLTSAQYLLVGPRAGGQATPASAIID